MEHSMRSSVTGAVVAVSTLLAALAVVPVAMALKPTRDRPGATGQGHQ